MRQTVSRRKAFRAALALAGITQRGWAQSVGITPEHLTLVLTGKRESQRLTERIDAFIEKYLPQMTAGRRPAIPSPTPTANTGEVRQ